MTNEAQRNEDTVEPLVRHVWVVALVLERTDGTTATLSQTVSWRSCETQEEALGQAVIFAAKDKPGFGVKLYTVAKIELPNAERLPPQRSGGRQDALVGHSGS